MKYVDVADLDCIYLTYDEPQKEEFWIKIKNIIPWVKRVDGIKGSDAAHKAAGETSSTERFILIDGDNIPDENFFNQVLSFNNVEEEKSVFRWKSKNHVNGLCYGNGGISSWTRTYVANMKTHENTDGRNESLIEFCFESNYWAMHDCYSTTYINGSPKQAWRAGYREGVKMCLDRGKRPLSSEFHKNHKRNIDYLGIWLNIGQDVEHGIWAMVGARMGTFNTMLTEWDFEKVKDFDELNSLWEGVKNQNPKDLLQEFESPLSRHLRLPVSSFPPLQSNFFKYYYSKNFVNKGVMVRE